MCSHVSRQLCSPPSQSSNCSQCGLPTITCLCAALIPCDIHSRFLILTSPKEVNRPTNTGCLLQRLTPQATQLILWERQQPSAELMKALQPPAQPYLVFPADPNTPSTQLASQVSTPNPLFILLDGTWQEARKIARKSNYLKSLTQLQLPQELHSSYRLRRGQQPGALCTIEAAVECLKLAGEADNAEYIRRSFELFMKHYLAGRSGHQVS